MYVGRALLICFCHIPLKVGTLNTHRHTNKDVIRHVPVVLTCICNPRCFLLTFIITKTHQPVGTYTPVHCEGRRQFQEIILQSCNQLPNMKASIKFTSRRFTDSECADDHKYT